jgi:hypothetical protein
MLLFLLILSLGTEPVQTVETVFTPIQKSGLLLFHSQTVYIYLGAYQLSITTNVNKTADLESTNSALSKFTKACEQFADLGRPHDNC